MTEDNLRTWLAGWYQLWSPGPITNAEIESALSLLNDLADAEIP